MKDSANKLAHSLQRTFLDSYIIVSDAMRLKLFPKHVYNYLLRLLERHDGVLKILNTSVPFIQC